MEETLKEILRLLQEINRKLDTPKPKYETKIEVQDLTQPTKIGTVRVK